MGENSIYELITAAILNFCSFFHRSSSFLCLIQGQPTIFSRSTHHRELFSLASLHLQPSQHHKLTANSYFLPTCSLLTSIVTTGSIFCQYPSFSFYLTSHYYSTTIIRCGFSSANANLVILLTAHKLNYSYHHPRLRPRCVSDKDTTLLAR